MLKFNHLFQFQILTKWKINSLSEDQISPLSSFLALAFYINLVYICVISRVIGCFAYGVFHAICFFLSFKCP